MKSAAQLLHQHIGAPRVDACAPLDGVVCWMCAGPVVRGVMRDDFMGANFVGQNRVRAPASNFVCEACVYVCSRITPVPGRPAKEGKKFGACFRNLSHLYDDAAEPKYSNASKGEKPAILAFIRAPHAGVWFAAIAESGQKHTLPWAPINPPSARGRVLFEEQVVDLPDAAGWNIVDDLAALLTAGATKEEIARGDYGPRACALAWPQIEQFEAKWSGLRGGDWFDLVVFLAQRNEEAVAERLTAEKETKKNAKARRSRQGATANADGGVRALGAKRVPAKRASEPAQTLGSDPEPDAKRGAPKRERRRVDDAGDARAQPRQPEQRSLFDDPRPR